MWIRKTISVSSTEAKCVWNAQAYFLTSNNKAEYIWTWYTYLYICAHVTYFLFNTIENTSNLATVIDLKGSTIIHNTTILLFFVGSDQTASDIAYIKWANLGEKQNKAAHPLDMISKKAIWLDAPSALSGVEQWSSSSSQWAGHSQRPQDLLTQTLGDNE